jgi:tetratricopeptide (TPR) repeat protein
MEKRAVAKRSANMLALLALTVAIFVTGLLSLFPIHSFDIWWHLRTGQLIVEQLRIPTADPFSYTATDHPWVTHEWLSEVIFYGLFRLGGGDLLVIFKACAAALAVFLGAAAALVGGSARQRWPALALGVLLAAPLISTRAFVRPHLLTAVMLGATLLLLRLTTVSGHSPWPWLLVPLFVLWANIHSGFILGILLVILYWTGELFSATNTSAMSSRRSLWRSRGPLLLLVLLATLINPHHIRAFLYPLKLIFRPEVRGSIAELQSVFQPVFQGALFRKALVFVVALLATLVVTERRRLDWSLLLPCLIFLVLALRSVRGLTEFAVLVPAAVGLHGRALGKRSSTAMATSVAVIILAAGVAAGALSRGIPMGPEETRRVGLGFNPVNRPTGAVRFLQQTSPRGRIFNVMAFGGYLIYQLWPERQVYVDGRLDVYPPEFLDRYRKMMDTGDGWQEQVFQYDITTALVDYGEDPTARGDLRARLRQDPEWVCVFFGDNALIYIRKGSGNDHILDRYASSFDPSQRSLASLDAFAARSSPEELDRTVAALERMADLTPDEQAPALVLGRLLDRMGHSRRGAEWLQRAVRQDPSSFRVRLMWAEALLRAGDYRAARRELHGLLERAPGSVPVLLALADVERETSHLREAVEILERAASVAPDHFLVQLRLGVLSAQLGDVPKARSHFRRAENIRPGDPAVRQNLERLQRIGQRREEER